MDSNLTCLGQTNAITWCQEMYETASRDAGRRAHALRSAGYDVCVSSLGPQLTPMGRIRITMVDIQPGLHANTSFLPPVRIVDGY